LACFPRLGLGGARPASLDSAQVLHAGRFWQLVIYAFFHPPSGLLWFAIEIHAFRWPRSGTFMGAALFSPSTRSCLIPSLFLFGARGNGLGLPAFRDFTSAFSSLRDDLPKRRTFPHYGEGSHSFSSADIR
jgi:hypothetical protein